MSCVTGVCLQPSKSPFIHLVWFSEFRSGEGRKKKKKKLTENERRRRGETESSLLSSYTDTNLIEPQGIERSVSNRTVEPTRVFEFLTDELLIDPNPLETGELERCEKTE